MSILDAQSVSNEGEKAGERHDREKVAEHGVALNKERDKQFGHSSSTVDSNVQTRTKCLS